MDTFITNYGVPLTLIGGALLFLALVRAGFELVAVLREYVRKKGL